jgi:integrase
MLRISNLAPSSPSSFNPLRHLRRGNVTLYSDRLVIWLRWTKTLQRFNQSARVQLFPIPSSPLCPLRAFQLLQHFFPVRPTDPLLSYRSSGGLIILSQGDLWHILRSLITSLGLHPSLSFHAFRRSAASLAHSAGLSFQAIQSHGTWSSDALLAYFDAGARDPAVPQFFSSYFSSYSS